MPVNLHPLLGSRKEFKIAKKMTIQFCKLKMFSKIKCHPFLELNVLKYAEFETRKIAGQSIEELSISG